MFRWLQESKWSLVTRLLGLGQDLAWGTWQYSQRPFARCQTSRVSAASMSGVSRRYVHRVNTERAAGFGFEDGKQRPALAKPTKEEERTCNARQCPQMGAGAT